MKSLDINLAARPYRNDTPLIAGLVLLAGAAVGLTTYNTWAFVTAEGQVETLRASLANHQVSMAKLSQEATQLQAELRKIDVDLLSVQTDFVGSILEQRNFSWTRLFTALEQTVPWSSRLTSVRPTFNSGVVAIDVDGVSRNNDAYFDFQEALQRSAWFSNVVPGNSSRGELDDRIYFSLSFRYHPDEAPHASLSAGARTASPSGAANDRPADDASKAGVTVEEFAPAARGAAPEVLTDRADGQREGRRGPQLRRGGVTGPAPGEAPDTRTARRVPPQPPGTPNDRTVIDPGASVGANLGAANPNASAPANTPVTVPSAVRNVVTTPEEPEDPSGRKKFQRPPAQIDPQDLVDPGGRHIRPPKIAPPPVDPNQDPNGGGNR